MTTFDWGRARIHTYETPVDAMRGVTRLMLEGKINRRRKYAIVRMCQKNWSPAERLDRIPGTLRHTGKPIGNIFFYDYLSEGKNWYCAGPENIAYFRKELEEAYQKNLLTA